MRERFIKTVLVLGTIGLMMGAGTLWWIARSLPSVNNIIERHTPVSTKIYDRTGATLLYELYAEEKRTPVKLERLPEHLKWATIVREDKDFYRHGGVSMRGLARALFVDITKGKSHGGSTITQQFVKNAVLTNEKTLTRKVKEVILTWRIEKAFTKDQILEMYLNEIPYGGSTYGIEAAANTFFGIHAEKLSLAEAATLAVIPKLPTFYSPYGSHRKELFIAQQYLIDQMAENGYITKEQATAAKQEKITFQPFRDQIIAPHFVMYVREWLADRYDDRELRQGGFKVITSLDRALQETAEQAVKEGVAQNEKNYQATNAALLSMNPRNGEIVAMVGSRDYFDTEHDGNFNVTLAPRQPGSSFKPIVYATLFTHGGYTPETVLFDVDTVFKTDTKDYAPKNYDGKERGPVSIRKALAGSLNTPAVKALYLAGIDNVLDQAEQWGYTTLGDRSRFGLSLVLGGGEVKLIEHLAAIASLGQDGVRFEPTAVLKIEDNTGATIYEARKQKGTEALPPQAARQITSILSDNDARAFMFGAQSKLQLGSRPVAAKTGTTNDFRDAWTVGFTPSLAVGVWVGNNDFSAMKKGADGSVVAAPIWNMFMQKALEGTPIESFLSPDAYERPNKPMLNGETESADVIRIDKASGKLATALTPPSYVMEYRNGSVHTILHYVNKDDPTGPPPSDPRVDPQYENWENAVQRWASANGFHGSAITPPSEYDDLHTEANRPRVTLLSPQNGTTIASDEITIHLDASAPRGVRRAEVRIDGQLINTAPTNPPITMTLPVNSFTNGEHTVTVTVFDDIDNNASASASITIARSGGAAQTITWRSPQHNARLTKQNFPQPIVLSVNGMTAQKIDLYLKEVATGNTSFLGVAIEDENRFTFVWDQIPAPGRYRLSALITAEDGQIREGNGIDVSLANE